MSMNIAQLQRMLGSDEPDYARLARLGPQLLPQLARLVTARNEYVAANAASLAGMIDGDRALPVLERAARSRSAEVRTAAAGALRNMKHPRAVALLMALLDDADKGVRKFAIKASANRGNAALAAKLRSLGARDPSRALRVLALRAAGGGPRLA